MDAVRGRRWQLKWRRCLEQELFTYWRILRDDLARSRE